MSRLQIFPGRKSGPSRQLDAPVPRQRYQSAVCVPTSLFQSCHMIIIVVYTIHLTDPSFSEFWDHVTFSSEITTLAIIADIVMRLATPICLFAYLILTTGL